MLLRLYKFYTIFFVVLHVFCFGVDAKESSKTLIDTKNFIPTQIVSTQFNCGPIVLREFLSGIGRTVDLDVLIKDSDTVKGTTSLLGLQKALKKQKIKSYGAKLDIENLPRAFETMDVILFFSENHHFVLLKNITGQKIAVYDPAWISESRLHVMSLISFNREWKGEALLVERPKKGK